MPKRRKNQQKPQFKQQLRQQPFELTITEVSRSGAGLGRDVDGRAVFVPFTASGDTVKVRLVKSKPSYAEAELLEIITASPQRQTPPCPVYTQCGGCQWQHLPYSEQWKIKSDGVTESLLRAGISTKIKLEEYPATTIWAYRNRVQLRRKSSQLGFYSRQSHQIVPITQCAIARPEINTAITEILYQLENENSPKNTASKLELFLNSQGEVQQNLDAQQHTSRGFRQINDEQNVNLQSWINQSIRAIYGILDLYGGSGNLSLALADTVSHIHCVDLSIVSSNYSFPDNISFHQSAVKPWLERRVEQNKYARKAAVGPQSWLALLDPPRGGLEKDGDIIIQCLSKLNVSSVVLVGCKTDPWSRDIAKFISHGWRLDKIAVFDFFPQTFHVESAALLTRNS